MWQFFVGERVDSEVIKYFTDEGYTVMTIIVKSTLFSAFLSGDMRFHCFWTGRYLPLGVRFRLRYLGQYLCRQYRSLLLRLISILFHAAYVTALRFLQAYTATAVALDEVGAINLRREEIIFQLGWIFFLVVWIWILIRIFLLWSGIFPHRFFHPAQAGI